MSGVEQPRTVRTPLTPDEGTAKSSANKVVKTANTTANTKKFDTRTSTLNVVWVPLLCYPPEMRANAPRIGIARPRAVSPPQDFLGDSYYRDENYFDDLIKQFHNLKQFPDDPTGPYVCELLDVVAWMLWHGWQEELWHLDHNGLPVYGDGNFFFREVYWHWRVDVGGGLEATVRVWNDRLNSKPQVSEYWAVVYAPT